MENFICSICNKDTSNVDYDYLVGYDHLSCVLQNEKSNNIELCVLCGSETPYRFKDHIDTRYGYVEGCGQLCEPCYTKGTNREQLLIPVSTILTTPNDAELGGKIRNLYWSTK